MIIDCISDLHGHYPELEGGNLLIVAGDLTARDESDDYNDFCNWLMNQNYEKKIFIGGNHDNLLKESIPKIHYCPVRRNLQTNKTLELFEYLCDSGTEFEGLKIWGSPWTKTFPGMNPHCKAFTVDTEEELAQKWALIPKDIDILITHSPPYGILDRYYNTACDGKFLHRIYNHAGSKSLYEISTQIKPKLHVFGHIHASNGVFKVIDHRFLVNASIMNDNYKPLNKPIRIEL